MFKKIIYLLLLVVLHTPAVASDNNIEEKINTLNNTSIKSLGISLNALAYLVSASPNAYMPLRYLERSGDMDYIKELEKANYVKVNIVDGLPDGRFRDQKQVNVIPLPLGREVQRCMTALKHNKSTQPTQ